MQVISNCTPENISESALTALSKSINFNYSDLLTSEEYLLKVEAWKKTERGMLICNLIKKYEAEKEAI